MDTKITVILDSGTCFTLPCERMEFYNGLLLLKEKDEVKAVFSPEKIAAAFESTYLNAEDICRVFGKSFTEWGDTT